jgi:hypothetical protein
MDTNMFKKHPFLTEWGVKSKKSIKNNGLWGKKYKKLHFKRIDLTMECV